MGNQKELQSELELQYWDCNTFGSVRKNLAKLRRELEEEEGTPFLQDPLEERH